MLPQCRQEQQQRAAADHLAVARGTLRRSKDIASSVGDDGNDHAVVV